MIDELAAVFAPPSAPIHPGNYRLVRSKERALGVRLPDDLVDISSRYGTGYFEIEERIRIYFLNPFDPDFRTVQLKQVHVAVKGELRDWMPYVTPGVEMLDTVYPEMPGVLPVFGDDNGCYLCYANPMEREASLVEVAHGGGAELHEESLLNFMVRVFGRREGCYLWSEECFEGEIKLSFTPGEMLRMLGMKS